MRLIQQLTVTELKTIKIYNIGINIKRLLEVRKVTSFTL